MKYDAIVKKEFHIISFATLHVAHSLILDIRIYVMLISRTHSLLSFIFLTRMQFIQSECCCRCCYCYYYYFCSARRLNWCQLPVRHPLSFDSHEEMRGFKAYRQSRRILFHFFVSLLRFSIRSKLCRERLQNVGWRIGYSKSIRGTQYTMDSVCFVSMETRFSMAHSYHAARWMLKYHEYSRKEFNEKKKYIK